MIRKIKLTLCLIMLAGITSICNRVEAAQTYVLTATASDSGNCAAPNSCNSSSYVVTSLSPGDTVYIMNNPFGEYRASTCAYACIDTQNWGTLRARTSDYFYFIGQGTTTVIRGCSQFLGVRESMTWIWFQSMTFLAGTGAHAVQVAGSSIAFVDIYIKDGVSNSGQYNDVVAFESFDGVTSANDCVWRRGLIAGSGKYMLKVGGSTGFARRNLIDGVVIRWDGINSTNPSGGIAFYGATGTIDGADDDLARNVIHLDYNPSSFHTGGGPPGAMIYHPHAATDVKSISIISVNCSTCAGDQGGWWGGEDSAARNEIWNSVFWGVKKQPLASFNTTSSVTARNVTIYAKDGATDFHPNTPNYENIHRWFTNNPGYATKSGLVSLSSGANAGDTNGFIFNAFAQSSNTLLITSPTIQSQIGTGIGGADRGARITSLAGDGTGTYSSTYSFKIHGNVPRFPIQNDWAIKDVLCNSVTSISGNGNLRGVCQTTHSISWYILTQLQPTCPDGLCPETLVAGGGGGGDPPPPSGGTSNQTIDIHGVGFIKFGPGYIKTQ